MINIFKNLLLVLNQNQKKKLYSLQGLIFLSTIIEIFSVAIIAPFMAIVGNVGIIDSNGIIKSLYISSGASSAQHFLILSGIFVLIILFTNSSFDSCDTFLFISNCKCGIVKSLLLIFK